MKKILTISVIAIVLLVGLWVIRKKTDLFSGLKNPFVTAPVVIDETPVIIEEIKPLAQLMTLTYTDEVVADTFKSSKKISSLIPVTGGALLQPALDRLVITGRGRAIIGTDLKGLTKEDISIAGDTVSITIPPAKILETVINPGDFEIFDEKGTWPEQAVVRLKMKIRETIEKRAGEQNLIELAQKRSKSILEDFLKNTGFRVVEVNIEDQ